MGLSEQKLPAAATIFLKGVLHGRSRKKVRRGGPKPGREKRTANGTPK